MLPDSILPTPEDDIARQLSNLEKQLSHLERLEGGVWHFIEEIIVSVATGTIDFQNIPGNFRHLWIIYNLRSDRAGDILDGVGFRFNADAGANYDNEFHSVDAATLLAGSGVDGPGLTAMRGQNIPATLAAANYVASGKVFIPYYSTIDFYKTLINEFHFINAQTNAGILSGQVTGSWRNTVAITRVQLITLFGGQFDVNNRAVLYGLL